MTDIYVSSELSGELEALGVEPMIYRDLEVKQNGQYLNMPISIFCLLYPENAEMVAGEGWQAWCLALLQTWQDGMDWQSFVAEAVERRKAEAKGGAAVSIIV